MVDIVPIINFKESSQIVVLRYDIPTVGLINIGVLVCFCICSENLLAFSRFLMICYSSRSP